MAGSSLVAGVEGLLIAENYLQPWKIYLRVDQLRPFGSRQCCKMVLGVLGSSRHGLILAPQWWHFLRNNFRGVEYFVGGIQRNLSCAILLSWWHLWCWLLPHASLTLNLHWQYRMNPKLSGYAQLHGEFNYNVTPLDPPGTQVIIHEKPTVIGTWESHGLKGWYLGPSMNHYRCYYIYVTRTRG